MGVPSAHLARFWQPRKVACYVADLIEAHTRCSNSDRVIFNGSHTGLPLLLHSLPSRQDIHSGTWRVAATPHPLQRHHRMQSLSSATRGAPCVVGGKCRRPARRGRQRAGGLLVQAARVANKDLLAVAEEAAAAGTKVS